jgi:hypothetical protein
MRIVGKVSQVLPVQDGLSQHGNAWRKQTIVVSEDDPNIAFPDEVVLDLFNDRIPETPLAAGQRVDAHFGIRAREYNGRWYNEVYVVKLKVES